PINIAASINAPVLSRWMASNSFCEMLTLASALRSSICPETMRLARGANIAISWLAIAESYGAKVGSSAVSISKASVCRDTDRRADNFRSEEHTSELQSRFDLVCRLLLEK